MFVLTLFSSFALAQECLGAVQSPEPADGERRHELLLPKFDGFTAFYERVATESLYGGTPRAFFRFVAVAPRNRAVRH